MVEYNANAQSKQMLQNTFKHFDPSQIAATKVIAANAICLSFDDPRLTAK
ncbi:MAG TPA: hypothetical protein VMA09_17355 [Candidatus Binataceae bacterium]|nr:hypothetical protein [Candidatus Binataceae bacterium]